MLEGLAFQELHGDERLVLVFVNLVNRAGEVNTAVSIGSAQGQTLEL
jgi:hypothetical protein